MKKNFFNDCGLILPPRFLAHSLLISGRCVQEIVDIYLKKLPLSELVQYDTEDEKLDWKKVALIEILQILSQHEGIGLPLMMAGLSSPATFVRREAIRCAEAWLKISGKLVGEYLPKLYQILLRQQFYESDEEIDQFTD